MVDRTSSVSKKFPVNTWPNCAAKGSKLKELTIFESAWHPCCDFNFHADFMSLIWKVSRASEGELASLSGCRPPNHCRSRKLATRWHRYSRTCANESQRWATAFASGCCLWWWQRPAPAHGPHRQPFELCWYWRDASSLLCQWHLDPNNRSRILSSGGPIVHDLWYEFSWLVWVENL